MKRGRDKTPGKDGAWAKDGERLPSVVRSSCAAVCTHLRFITIDWDQLPSLVEEIAASISASETLVHERPEPNDRESSAFLVLAKDAINFGSGYQDVLRKIPGLSGARTMAASLDRFVAESGPLSAERLRSITIQDCSRIFGQELDGKTKQELMGLFATALGDLGRFLSDAYDESASQLIDAAQGSASTFAELLCEMPFYRDVGVHMDVPVAFYKRAQITAADLARAGLAEFTDLSELTAFADNLVPHVLRVTRVLKYAESLADRIDAGTLLDSGCTEELEIRATGVVVVERIVEDLRAAGVQSSAMDVDLWLWERGGAPEFKSVRRHRSRSVFY